LEDTSITAWQDSLSDSATFCTASGPGATKHFGPDSAVGLLFYANPWMASSVQTEEKQLYRWALTGVLMIATFILLIVWLITYVKRPQSVIVQGKSDSE
jgi:hypothetical protein